MVTIETVNVVVQAALVVNLALHPVVRVSAYFDIFHFSGYVNCFF